MTVQELEELKKALDKFMDDGHCDNYGRSCDICNLEDNIEAEIHRLKEELQDE